MFKHIAVRDSNSRASGAETGKEKAMSNTKPTRELSDLRNDFATARTKLEAQRDSVQAELSAEQRRAIAASVVGDSKAGAGIRAHLTVLAGTLQVVEEELRAFQTRQAEAEIQWAEERIAAREAALPSLDADVQKARDAARRAEAGARQDVLEATEARGTAEQRLRDATSDIENCRLLVGANKVVATRMSPVPTNPAVNALPLSQRVGVFVCVRPTFVEGREVLPGQMVRLDGAQSIGFPSAAKSAPDQPPKLRAILEQPAPDPGPLTFLYWEPAPPEAEAPDLAIPKAELAPHVITPAPRRVRVKTAIVFRGQGVPAGTVLDLTPGEAADMRGNVHVEACK